MRPLSNGDACSDAAAESVAPHAAKLRRLIWQHARNVGPLTCDEAERNLDLSHQTCSARFTELRRCGALARTGTKRTTRAGRQAWVHEATKIEPL